MRTCAALQKLSEDVEEDGEGTMHFMVNVVQPQFNLDSEEANVCFLTFFRLFGLLPSMIKIKCSKLHCSFLLNYHLCTLNPSFICNH
jgi:hypothetical protein